MATYLLVHGGGHGGWCYKKVATLLQAAGHVVYAPSLTGCGDRAHLVSSSIDLDVQINDVVQILKYEDLHDVILAGHSYGGMVITGVADRARERIKRLVYLDAAHPHNGQSLCDNAPEPMAFTKSGLRVVNGVELVLWPDQISPTFFGITDPADVAWAAARLTPHPWKCFAQKLVLQDEAAVRRIPRTNINCTASLARSSKEARERQVDGEHAWEIDTGHDLMITEHVKVADMLLKLA